MRVPNLYWSKKGYDKFLTTVIEHNDVRYGIKDIISTLPDIKIAPENSGWKGNSGSQRYNTEKAFKSDANKHLVDNIALIKGKKVEDLKESLFGSDLRKVGTREECKPFSSYLVPPETPAVVVNNREELYDEICKINLVDFLGLPYSQFCCLFHKDNNPSASIWRNPDTGHYLYTCHSSNCSFGTGSIIKVVERLQGSKNKPQAINFIKNVYGIKLLESDWQKEQKEILQVNKEYLMNSNFQYEYPELYKRIKNYIPQLNILQDVAIKNVYSDLQIVDDNVAFFASIRYLSGLVGMQSLGALNERINLFAYLGLINKLAEDAIPEDMLKRAKHEAAKNHQKNIKSHYSIPSYCDDILSFAESKAKTFKERNMTMKGMSRELIFRTEGEEEADRVFPLFKGNKVTNITAEQEFEFDKILLSLVDYQGYATEKQMLSYLKGNTPYNEILLKRLTQETMDKYDLKKTRADKDLKEKLGIPDKGYPNIIIRNS